MAEEWCHQMASWLTPQHKTMWVYPTETRKTRNNQTDPNPNEQLLLGSINPPYRGRTTNLAAPVYGSESRLPLTIQSIAKKVPFRKTTDSYQGQPRNSTHAPPPPLNNKTNNGNNGDSSINKNLANPTGQQTNLKMKPFTKIKLTVIKIMVLQQHPIKPAHPTGQQTNPRVKGPSKTRMTLIKIPVTQQYEIIPAHP